MDAKGRLPGMTGPPPETTRREIAKKLGWTMIRSMKGGVLAGYHPDDGPLPKSPIKPLPNWPGDNNMAYGLPGTISDRFVDCLAEIMNIKEGDLDYPPYARNGLVYVSSKYPTMCPTAEQWCLAWLLSEHGWRWVACAPCKGSGATHIRCPDCKGKGGEWEKVRKHE